MKQIKPHVNCYCTFCKAAGAEKVKAGWRSSSMSGPEVRACDDHRPQLQEAESDSRDDGDMSEADEQTWGRM